MFNSDLLALDRAASVRTYDSFGRLHVSVSNISKGNCCPYYGREIPNSAALGLDPDKLYTLYRDPDELRKAAPTFNNIQLLMKHVGVTADMPRKELVVGSTGTDAVFRDPYLRNSLVIWDAEAIHDVEARRTHELSCSYRYDADMTPGEVAGIRYDGVMRNIVGNHVALVVDGRAGDDVVVGDAMPLILKSAVPDLLKLETQRMPTLSKKATLAQGALRVYLAPKLAADAQIDLRPILQTTTAKTYKSDKPKIAASLKALVTGKLAADANLDDVMQLLDRLDDEVSGSEDAEEETPEQKKMREEKAAKDAEEAETPEEKEARMKARMKAKDKAARDAAAKAVMDAENEDPDAKAKREREGKEAADKAAKDKAAMDKTAMDAQIKLATDAAITAERERNKQQRDAEQFVRPWVGDLLGQDSAEGVFRTTLGMLGKKHEHLHVSALRDVIDAQPKPNEQRTTPRLAMDATAAKSFAERFPNHKRLAR